MPDPKKQKKRVWKVDFHESDQQEKISLHNAKKYAIAGLREKKKKAVSDPHLLCRAGRPQIFEEQVCGNRKKPSKVCRQDK